MPRVPGADAQGAGPTGGLSRWLRDRTGEDHARLEADLGLPDRIRDARRYADWLAATRSLLRPLLRGLAAFPSWDEIGLDPPHRAPLDRLDADLGRLAFGTEGPAEAPPDALPPLPSFARALGARYVVEGAALGGRVMLRDLVPRLGQPIEGATAFLAGPGPEAGASWARMRAALDLHGRRHPRTAEEVAVGACQTFEAFGRWLRPALGTGR